MRTLLVNNGNCALPCIWGIVPGESSFQEAQQFFSYLGWKGDKNFGNYGWIYETFERVGIIDIYVDAFIYAPNDVVEKINFGLGGNSYVDYIKYYSFENIMKVLGKPSRVLAFISPPMLESSTQTIFGLLLYYETPNILVAYDGTANKVGANYQICLTHPNEHSIGVSPLSGSVRIYIGEPGKISSPDELVFPFWNIPFYYIRHGLENHKKGTPHLYNSIDRQLSGSSGQ